MRDVTVIARRDGRIDRVGIRLPDGGYQIISRDRYSEWADFTEAVLLELYALFPETDRNVPLDADA